MSWISPTFGNEIGASTPTPKRRKTIDISISDASNTASLTPKSSSNWFQKYYPKNVEDLVVNIKKLNELESWLKQSYTKSTPKYLLLTGPSGCGKTTALEVLCKKLAFKIQEWISPLDRLVDESEYNSKSEFSKSTAKQFEEYLFRSSRYGSCLSSSLKKSLVLVKDFPNVFIHNPLTFHELLGTFSDNCINPVVFICSDESICRKLFPVTMKESCNIQTINFNPIPDQRIIKVLKNVIQQESKHDKNIRMLPHQSFSDISSACQGDLRSAILKLSFCVIDGNSNISQQKQKAHLEKAQSAKEIKLPAKDNRIDFFRGIGRVLYPKRIDSEKGLRFVHSTNEIVETFLSEPNNLINQLRENYPTKIENVYDLSNAADRLSTSNILMARWQEKDIFHTYSLSLVVQGLMVSNKTPQKGKFEAFRKSQTSRIEIDSKALEMEGKHLFSDFHILDYERLLDYLPFFTHNLPNLNHNQAEYVRRVCRFK